MSTDTTLDRATIRERLKNNTPEEFQAAHTRKVMDEMAETMGADISEAKNKGDVYTAIVAVADLPDPSLRGKSTIDSPCSVVWNLADEHVAQKIAAGEPPMRRKDVIALAESMGVAYYTARTQYQSWFAATDRGAKVLSSLAVEDLPEELRPKQEDEAQDES